MAEDAKNRGEGKAPRVSIARLPATGRDLFGREADLAWLDACWEEGVHVATVVAFGGVGKTALVNRWLANLRDKGWQGAERVYGWSFYSQGTDQRASSDAFFSDALRWFGDTEPAPTSPWEKGARLAERVRKERVLLVLDGVEPLQWGPGVQEGQLKDPSLATLVKELGAQNKGLCVVSSRFALTDLDGLMGEKVRANELADLSPAAGADLLRARGAKGTDDELRLAATEYKGHGLALTLLGSYLQEVAEGDIRRRREIGPLEEDERKGGHARRVMAAYERMFRGQPELAILRMLGLFDRPADEGEIKALRQHPPIAGLTVGLENLRGHGWNKAVARLGRAGLLAPDSTARRLDAHPLVREYFGEQLRRELPEGWKKGHERLYEYLKRNAKLLPETIDEMAPLYAAVVHGCLAGKNRKALDEVWWKRIQRGDEYFSPKKLGAFGSEVAALSAFFAPPWEHITTGLSKSDQALVLNAAGFALRALGRLLEAAELLKLSMEHCIARKDWEGAAIRASNYSELLHARGDLHEALAQAQRGVELADKSGNAFRRLYERTTLAAVLHAMGRRKEAAEAFVEAETIQAVMRQAYMAPSARDRRVDRSMLTVYYGLKGGIGRATALARDPLLFSVQGFRYRDLLRDEGRQADVRQRAAHALEIAERKRWLLDIALEHLSLGRDHVLAARPGGGSDFAQASTHLDQAVDGLRRAGYQENLPPGLLARAALHVQKCAFALARRDLDESLLIATRCGFRLHEADAHLGYARLCLAEDHPAAARDHLANARTIIDQTGYHRRDEELAELERETARAQGPQGSGEIKSPLPLAVHSETASPPPTPASGIAATPSPEIMAKDQLLDALGKLLPAQLDTLIYKLDVPVEYLSGPNSAPATRSIEILRWAEQRGRLADVARLLADVASPQDRTR